jgi:hypothetical protein
LTGLRIRDGRIARALEGDRSLGATTAVRERVDEGRGEHGGVVSCLRHQSPDRVQGVPRYFEDGGEGDVRAHEDRPRRPMRHPQTMDAERTDLLIRARKLRPHWGPRKLRVWLARACPRVAWPAPSTIGEILKRHGLVPPRHRRRRTPPFAQPFAACGEPNATSARAARHPRRDTPATRAHPAEEAPTND